MDSADDEYRLYRELAEWWPLISPAEEYTEEAGYLAAVLRLGAASQVRDVLDLGSGGGHMAVHLKDQFTLTLVDLSADMLTVSQRLNPECAHLPGDMRTVRLGRSFDAVLVHDAIDYVTTKHDLGQVIETAYAHCRPGAVAAFVPDYVKDSFAELTGSGGGAGADQAGREASFRERTWDPDPSDDWVQSDYEFTLRRADGSVEVIGENHRLGAFSQDTWARLLARAGFEPLPVPQAGLPPGRPANLFTGRRPGAN